MQLLNTCFSSHSFVATHALPHTAQQSSPTCDQAVVTARDDAYATPMNTPVLLEPLDNDGVGVPGAVGGNAGDLVVADPLLFAGRHGTCTFYEASAGAATPDLSTTLLWYTPSEDFHGEDRCVYKACDSAAHCDVASIVITVLPSPGDPVARDDLVETPKDTPVVVYPLANDDTPEGHALSVTAIAGGGEAEHGECVVTSDETVLYVPEPGYAGLDECQYRACDNQGKCDEATIKIKVVGEADEPCDDKNSAEVSKIEFFLVRLADVSRRNEPVSEPLPCQAMVELSSLPCQAKVELSSFLHDDSSDTVLLSCLCRPTPSQHLHRREVAFPGTPKLLRCHPSQRR